MRLIFCSDSLNLFPTWELFIPRLGIFHSQRGNNLRPYFFFFVEMWSVLVVLLEVVFVEADFVVAEAELPL